MNDLPFSKKRTLIILCRIYLRYKKLASKPINGDTFNSHNANLALRDLKSCCKFYGVDYAPIINKLS